MRTIYTLLPAVTLLVSLRPIHAQSNSMATLLDQQGNISVIKDPSSTYQTALFVGNQVRMGQIIVTGPDGYGKFKVQDGSTFEVFSDARVIFHPTLSFGDLLNVVIGKVKVYIQHLPNVPNPNNVTTPTALISVRGTIFVVDVQDEEGTTTVSVDEGQVSVRHLRMAGNTILLNPGETKTVDPRAPLAMGGRDKGGILQNVGRILDRATREVILRNPGGSSAPGGGPTTTPGQQGDKPKPTGTPSGTSNDKGTPSGSGAPPAPAPPPPGGGGGQ